MATVRALLLTDVVDSTRLAEALGDAAMADLWARHDRIARDLLPIHRGREIDKTDGFLMLFDEVTDAVDYAVGYHRALKELGIAARAGIHVGPVILTENHPDDVARGAKPLEVDGLAKPLAARVMSVALGGQTLLTADAAAALGDTDWQLRSHGHWRMKGVAEPVELYEVGDEHAPLTPPPDAAKVYRVTRRGEHWVPVKEVPHSLPAERDAFVGRHTDLQELANRLEGGARLVSVLGIGGTGKTRLVLHFGWTWLGDWPGGVWFCDLSDARDMDGIVQAVGRALGVRLSQGAPVDQLARDLARRSRCLVVLDNFEQVASYASDTLGYWLDHAPDARFVVTTREVLGLPGEEALFLAPLRAADSAALFLARARAARRDFEPESHLDAIDQLVELLDHLPLAIELAAARVRTMAPDRLLERMSERFRLLTSSGARRDRQATLRAALDGSWDPLTTDEKSALAQLSVFVGGFTLESVEAVLDLADLWPEDALQSLVDKSLVRPVSETRFDMLVSVQEYASEKLDASGARGAAETRHGTWAVAYAEGVLRDASPGGELENLVAACRRAVVRGDGSVASVTCRAAWVGLERQGPFARGSTLAAEVLAMPELPAKDRLLVGKVAGRALWLQGRPEEARTHFEQALRLSRELGDRAMEGRLLGDLAGVEARQGRPDAARAHLERALALAREQADLEAEAVLRGNLGVLYRDLGRMDEARACLERALALHREAGNRASMAGVLGNLGMLHSLQGRMDEARACYTEALELADALGDRQGASRHLGNLGILHRQQGRFEDARACFDQALAHARALGAPQIEATWLSNLGLLLHEDLGQAEQALACHEAALAAFREAGHRALEGIALGNLAVLHHKERRPSEAATFYAQALSVSREVGDRGFEGHVLGNIAGLAHEQGRLDSARTTYEQALALHREVGNRRNEGIDLGNLGAVLAELGAMPEALAAFDAGEALLRAVGETLQLGLLLCRRAEALAATDAQAAHAALAEAERLARSLDPGSELAGRLRELEDVVRGA